MRVGVWQTKCNFESKKTRKMLNKNVKIIRNFMVDSIVCKKIVYQKYCWRDILRKSLNKPQKLVVRIQLPK